MKKLKINIRPLSYLLMSNGEGGENIDSNLIFDEYGLPYIPGKRLKGLLKESMIEVMEMKGKNEAYIVAKIHSIFGESDQFDFENNNIEIPNFYLKDYYLIRSQLKSTGEPSNLYRSYLLEFFTKVIQQTAIDDNGIAKDRSLRNYRVLNYKVHDDIIFQGEIEIGDGADELIQHTLSNLRRAGLRRNRGFGKIKVRVDTENKTSVDSALEGQTHNSTPTTADHIKVTVHLDEPIVLSTMASEKNTIFTDEEITGNRVRGILASQFIKHTGLNTKQNNDLFKTLFLRNNLIFNQLTKEGRAIKSDAIQLEKYLNHKKPINVLSETKNPITKKWNAHLNKDNTEEIKVSKSHHFHSSRLNRTAGRSMKDDDEGGIFYMESVDRGQSFYGTIDLTEKRGDKILGELIKSVGGAQITCQIGKSKSAQYGKVSIQLETVQGDDASPVESYTISRGQKGYLVVESPLILFNDFGYPSSTKKSLESALDLDKKEYKLEKAASRITHVEQYNVMWKCKSGKIKAYAPGSTFLITATNNDITIPSQIGEWKDQGMGRVRVMKEEDAKEILEAFDESSCQNVIDEVMDNEIDSNRGNGHISVEKLFDFETANHLLTQLKKEAIENHKKVRHRRDGIKQATDKNAPKLSNSLISRVWAALHMDKKKYKDFINDIKEKEAGKKLRSVHLYDDLLNAYEKDKVEKWQSYFETLRKANKAANSKNTKKEEDELV
ncbi:MAG: RAMP superfamily CRISPR-associated protein [Saprospiraceae bacterium]